MKLSAEIVDPPARQALERGRRTMERVIQKTRARDLSALQTTTNEAAFLIEMARLALESGLGETDVPDKHFHAARLRALARVAELRKMAQPLLETGAVCELLGVSRETVRKKIDRKEILALPKGREDRVFPAFQFTDGEVLAGVKEVLHALDAKSPFVAVSFFLSRSRFLGKRTVIDALQSGMVEAVVAEAGSYLEHGS